MPARRRVVVDQKLLKPSAGKPQCCDVQSRLPWACQWNRRCKSHTPGFLPFPAAPDSAAHSARSHPTDCPDKQCAPHAPATVPATSVASTTLVPACPRACTRCAPPDTAHPAVRKRRPPSALPTTQPRAPPNAPASPRPALPALLLTLADSRLLDSLAHSTPHTSTILLPSPARLPRASAVPAPRTTALHCARAGTAAQFHSTPTAVVALPQTSTAATPQPHAPAQPPALPAARGSAGSSAESF